MKTFFFYCYYYFSTYSSGSVSDCSRLQTVIPVLTLFYRTEVIVYVVERSLSGTSKRIAASTLFNFLEQANIKAQLMQIGVAMSVTRTELSPAQLKQLLQNAPAGTSMGETYKQV